MSITQEKIAAKQKQRAGVIEQINLLNEGLEESTIAGDTVVVREHQAEIAARQAIVAAIDKAIADLHAGKTAEDIAAEKAAIDGAGRLIEKKTAELNQHVVKNVRPAFEAFIAALVHADSISNDRAEAIRPILRLIPQSERERYSNSFQCDTSIGAAIEDAMLKAGLFTKIAQAPWVRLHRHDTAGIAEVVEKRSARLLAVVARMVGIAKEEVGK